MPVALPLITPEEFAVLERCRAWVDTNPDNPSFEWSDVAGNWRSVARLAECGYLIITFNSNKHRYYQLAPEAPPDPVFRDASSSRDDIVPSDLFVNIAGYPDIKEYLLQTIVEGRRVHHFLLGPPASGKTMFLEEIQRLPSTAFLDGSSTSGAGIRKVIIEEDPKYLLIDEADHLREDAIHVLHGITESGMVREAKFTSRVNQRTDVVLFITSNTIRHLGESFLSRFQVWRFPEYSRTQFISASVAMLGNDGVSEKAARFIARRCWDTGSRDVREVRTVSQFCHTPEAVERYLSAPHRIPRSALGSM